MKMFNLFGKKCEYCKVKINKGDEVEKEVIIPGFTGAHLKNFCSSEHANKYEKEAKESIKKRRRSCCG